MPLLVAAVVAGSVSFLVSTPITQADFFSSLLEKMPRFIKEFSGIKPLEKSPAGKEKIGEQMIEKTAPYESVDIHEQAIIKAVDEASPSVVSIVISKDLPVIEQCRFNPLSDLPPEFQQFFGEGFGFTQPCQTGKTKRQEVGGGSGFVISSDGLILTNKHVVSDEKADYTVLTNDGKKYDAEILARDPAQDLAVVKIKASGLKPLKLGNSDSIKLGQTAIAIGNALAEFRNTVSVGVISGLARKITASTGTGKENLEGLIQTDAAINPGNSGGPLLNLKGEVVGMNTAIVSGAQNIGFAIPINKARRDIQSVKINGKITVPYLGVRYIMVNDKIAEKEKLKVKYGALIRGNEDGPALIKDSPAAKAGLQAEDIILEVNKEKADEDHSLSFLIQNYNVGDKVDLKILRNDKELKFSVILKEKE